MTDDSRQTADVVVVGAGIAGLTAAIDLARSGLSVVCVDPVRPPRERPGESLDWAAPALLERVGLPPDRLAGGHLATRKREVHGLCTSGVHLVGRTSAWMTRRPLRFPLETVHVDRRRFDETLCELATSVGVRFVWDQVVGVKVELDCVAACRTRSQGRLTARWFLDASGRARLFARAFGIDRREWGSARISIWAQREALQAVDGTMLHLDDGPADLRWAWEIPLDDRRQSVGVLISEAEFRRWRTDTVEPRQILADVASGFPSLGSLQAADLHGVQVRGVRNYMHERVSGRNWMMIGEAAASVDPLTSSGVSSAMRHGIEAAAVIERCGRREATRALRRFDRRVRSVSWLYNEAIEALLYSTAVRDRIGTRWAARAYVILGFGMSALYSRIGGSGGARHAAILVLANLFRLWLGGWRVAARLRRTPVSLTTDQSGRPVRDVIGERLP